MNKGQKQQVSIVSTEPSNVLYTLLGAVNFKFRKYINKLSNRIKCEHLHYYDIYCKDTGLFMYGKCCNCGKKR